MSETTTLAVQGGRALIGIRVVPSDGQSVMKIDMTDVYSTEARIEDIKHVNPHKAPELLTVFNQAYLQLSEYITQLEYQANRAANELDRIRGQLLIDVIPELITTKKLANSKDIRDALINADAGFQDKKDLYDQLIAVIANLKGKQKAIEMAYTSVKKIIGENNYDMTSRAGKRLLNGILDENKTAGEVQDSDLFGTANYNNRRTNG